MKNKNQLHFVEAGEGDISLVFLHYFGGSSKTWSAVMAALSGEYNCIAIDLPGFGDSPELKNNMSVSDNATAVFELIQFLKLTNYVLLGHSMGGKIALALASNKPTGLKEIVLIASSPATPEPMNDKERKQLQEAYGDRTALKNIINKIAAAPLTDCVVNSLIDDYLKALTASWNAWIEEGSREDISNLMAHIDIPVTVISGEEDAKLSTRFLHAEFVQYFPAAGFKEVKGAGHLIPVETPEILAKLIMESQS